MRTFADASRVLGQLELRLMDVLWHAKVPMAVRDVLRRLHKTKPAYTTVMTTLDRLFKKGILTRRKAGNAFVYQPAMDHDEYQRQVLTAAVRPLLELGAGPVLSAFVDVAAGVDARHLSELERLIEARRRR